MQSGPVHGEQPGLVLGSHARDAGVDHLHPLSEARLQAREVGLLFGDAVPEGEGVAEAEDSKAPGRIPVVLAVAEPAGVDPHRDRVLFTGHDLLDARDVPQPHCGVLDEDPRERNVLGPERPECRLEREEEGQRADAREEEIRDQALQGVGV